jgi:hypothetical protein
MYWQRLLWNDAVVIGALAAAALAFVPCPFTRCPIRLRMATASPDYVHLDQIDRVLCISDLHVDHADNMQWLFNRTSESHNGISLSKSDLVVVAGDISHETDRIEQSLICLLRTGASVLFVAGNHEAWLHSKEETCKSSMEKLDEIYRLCRELGVYSQTCIRVGGTPARPHSLWLVPMESWYDGSLSITECEDLCDDFGSWPWVDFVKCRWPGFEDMGAPNQKIPDGLSQYFANLNEPLLQALPKWITESSDDESRQDGSAAVMTISHFLPNQQCLPDWKEIDSPTFQRSQWLEHGGGGISAKFAKVAGTCLLDQQIRSLKLPSTVRRMHVFGHSHRPKDFEFQGIRYIHNPLGKPREREIHMVSPEVDFQEVWKSKDDGEVMGNQVIRFWEEQGGGLDALITRMANSKRKNRYGKYSKRRLEKQGNATKGAGQLWSIGPS